MLHHVCIAIPTRNRAHELARSMPSVLAASAGRDVILCDQSTRPFAYSGVHVLHRPEVAGLPAARNVLLQTAKDGILVFLDDDTDVAPDLLSRIEALATAEPDIAAWGPVVETRGPWPRRLHRLLHLGCLRDSRRLTSRPCDLETRELFGCCFAVRRSAALAVGGFDARLPGYALGEDRDFCWRLHEAGFRLRFASSLRSHHRAVGGQRPPLAARLRYLRWFTARHGRGNPATVLHLLLTAVAWSLAELLRPGARSA
jgi:mycofactocin glycosyltransferase